VARDLLRHIPRLEIVAEIVARQQAACPEEPQPAIPDRDPAILGGQILKICIKFERLIREGIPHVTAIEILARNPREYDPELVAALSGLPTEVLPCDAQDVPVDQLLCRMVLDEDLRTKDGMLLVTKGVEITETILTRIHNFYSRGSLTGAIRVLAPTSIRQWEASTGQPPPAADRRH
jgi:hypothetical protein